MCFSPLDSSDYFMGRGGLRFSLSLYFPSYDVTNGVIIIDADCTPGCEPRSVAGSNHYCFIDYIMQVLQRGAVLTLQALY